MQVRPSGERLRGVYQGQIQSALDMYESSPMMRLLPYGAGGPWYYARDLDRDELLSCALRQAESDMNRALRQMKRDA